MTGRIRSTWKARWALLLTALAVGVVALCAVPTNTLAETPSTKSLTVSDVTIRVPDSPDGEVTNELLSADGTTLYVGAQTGVTLGLTLTDGAGANVTTVPRVLVSARVGGSTQTYKATWSAAAGCYQVTIAPPDGRAASLTVSGLSFAVDPDYGTVTSTGPSSLAGTVVTSSGATETSVTSVSFVVEGEGYAVGLRNGGAALASGGTTTYLNALSGTAVVTDPLAQLLVDAPGSNMSAAVGSQELEVSLSSADGTTSTSTTPLSSLTASGGTWTTDVASPTSDGTYTYTLAYHHDLGGVYGFGARSAGTATATCLVNYDTTFSQASVPLVRLPDAGATLEVRSQETGTGEAVRYLVNAGNRLVVSIADDEGGSGLDPATLRLSYQCHDATMGGSQAGTLSLGSGIERAGNDEYAITLPDGVYRLDELSFTASDRAGNPLGPAVHATDAIEGADFDALLCDDFPKGASTRLGVTRGSGSWVNAEGAADTLMVTTGVGGPVPTVTAWVQDPGLFDFSSSYLGTRPTVVTVTYTDTAGNASAPVAYAADALSALPGGRHGQAVTLDQGTGKYVIDVTYRGATRSWTVFYGTGGSSLVGVALSDASSSSFVAHYDGGGNTDAHSDFVGFSPVMELAVSNPLTSLLPWGLGRQNVTVEGVQYRADGGSEWQGLSTPLAAKRGSSADLYEVEFSTPGEYDLSGAQVRMTDAFGVTTVHDLAGLLATSVDGTDDLTTVVTMDRGQIDPQVSVDVSDGEGVQGAARAGYHRGGVVVTAIITGNPYLDLYQHSTTATTDLLELVCDDCQGGTQTFRYDVVGYQPTTVTNPDGSVTKGWVATQDLSGDGLPQGVYRYTVTHNWPIGGTSSAEGSFVIDYQAPTLGDLELSVPGATAGDPGGPVGRWGILFYSRPVRVARTADDNVSGVDPDSARGSFVPDGGRTVRFDQASGRLVLDLPNDNDRLMLDQSSMTVSDLAGNEATASEGAPLDFLELVRAGRSNVDSSATEVVVDTEAPVLTLAFDNNDVRNGHYYNAGRTGTLTLVESTFDLVRANDPQFQVATVTHDGAARAITASDFQNPSGDGMTWVATIDATADGDWDVSASYTDVVGHSSEAVGDSFTVDTAAPVLTVSYDNNDARNGLYYNSPRTATVEVRERNFSPDLASVTATATDASGAAASAPGASGWFQTGEQYAQEATVYFGDELHYTLSATATDLAGNVAVAYEGPEFVIDMTSPVIDIQNVADRTAYAGTVAPYVSMQDTNYSLSGSGVTLVGAHAGEVGYMPGMSTDYTDTGESVTYADFAHELSYDDVYTLTAQATDLAGNSVEEARTFSVNRFGSNYVYSDATAALRGTYLRVPQDVSVTEINVSGLDDARTHVEVVENDEVRDLAPGEGMEVEKTDDAGWSATTYTIPAAEFSDDAYYRVLLTSRDLAGNLSQNLMDDKDADRDGVASIEFAVDGTAPTGGFAGAAQGAVYFGPDRDALPTASDNMALESVQVSLDGGEPVSYDAEEAANGGMSLVVPADAHPHDLTIVARDRAGNVRTQEARGVTVAADWGQYLLNNPGALFAVAGTVVATVGLAAIGVAAAVRHHRMGERRRNPFGH
ncbi:hypothetical protein [Olsenella sp. Marseille-P4559]|uniref:hypothetical protein n=1 Tax=Olsenella sp. Marseille-P4559 TaxID=2364795 RepID=UPI001032199D|nr:hypothetical protein [Olsenella sp. Marseille-P4559]